VIALTMLEALHVYLASKTAITSTAGVGARIYRISRPQTTSTLPAITYRKASGQDVLHQGGTNDLAYLRVEVECWGSNPVVAETIRTAVRNVCQRYSGTITSGAESVVVVDMTVEDDAEALDPPTDESISGVYSAIVDLFIWWRAPVPTG
jgi:hypothetical protein